MERLKDKAAAAAQAILEPGIATDDGQQMSREQFGVFIRRFAAASGLSFSAITDFLLVVPVFDYDPAITDPGELISLLQLSVFSRWLFWLCFGGQSLMKLFLCMTGCCAVCSTRQHADTGS